MKMLCFIFNDFLNDILFYEFVIFLTENSMFLKGKFCVFSMIRCFSYFVNFNDFFLDFFLWFDFVGRKIF